MSVKSRGDSRGPGKAGCHSPGSPTSAPILSALNVSFPRKTSFLPVSNVSFPHKSSFSFFVVVVKFLPRKISQTAHLKLCSTFREVKLKSGAMTKK